MRILQSRWSAVFIAAALVFSCSQADAESASVGPIQLVIPEGFAYATSARQGSMTVSAWTDSAGAAKTLLQVSVVDIGSSAESIGPAELADGSASYLLQFLQGVQRRRTDYTLSPIRHLTIAGTPAAMATWTGALDGLPMVGVMYCVIVHGRYVVSFHTQDLGYAPTPSMRQAMKAIETAQARTVTY